MQKKMMAAFAALCTMAALMTGCTDVSDGSQTQVDMNAATTAAETTAPAETAETDLAAETAAVVPTSPHRKRKAPPRPQMLRRHRARRPSVTPA